MWARELGSFEKWLSGSAVSDDVFWTRELGELAPIDIQLFYARCGLKGRKSEGVEAIERLQSCLILAAVSGEVGRAEMRLVMHQPPREPFLVDEFVDFLVKLRPTRRAAVLFALDTRSSPERALSLTWRDSAGLHQLSPLGLEVITARGKMRHLSLPYVFWEWMTPDTATPLIGLEESACHAFDCTWPALQVRFNEMLWVSGRANATSLVHLVEEVTAGRL